MIILGLSAFYHDSAAALIQDGHIIAAAQEERFTRKKHDNRFPSNAVRFVLKQAGIGVSDVDKVAYYEKPFLKFSRILGSFIENFPKGRDTFYSAMEPQLSGRLRMGFLIRRELGYSGPVMFVKHHTSHAASAFFASGYQEAAFLTIDGVGEWETTSFGVGSGNDLIFLGCQNFPHSLGLLYAAFTYFAGFKVNSGEYKVMGLAPYGEPKYVNRILTELMDCRQDGSFHLNMKYFNFSVGENMLSESFQKLFGRPARKPESLLTQDDMDMARSIQEVTELVVLRMAAHIRRQTGQDRLCLAGGVALNCVANGKLLRSGIFRDLWIQPAAGDAGGSLGAALYVWHKEKKNDRPAVTKEGVDRMSGSLLGPVFDDEYVREFLDLNGIPYRYCKNTEEVVADHLAEGKIIGWFSGKMEFGPRALGGRSILGDARAVDMQKKMNLKIKYRESFRPFAPAVLAEDAADWFELDRKSPYMLLVCGVAPKLRRNPVDTSSPAGLIDKINQIRSEIPAVTHVDYSARVQTVDKTANPRFHALLTAFKRKTGCPMLVNTSFNVRGEPVVCTPEEAYRCFMRTDIDYLVLENFIVDKREQKINLDSKQWQKEFVLD